METIHTVVEANFSSDITNEYRVLTEEILEIGESVKDISKHYHQIFVEGSLKINPKTYKKIFRGSLKPEYINISDKLLVMILNQSVEYDSADVYRNDEVFVVELVSY